MMRVKLMLLLSQLTGRFYPFKENAMPGQIRPDKKLLKLAYKILQTDKSLQQKDNKAPSDKRIEAWKINSSLSPR